MRKRADWMIVAIVAALLAAGVLVATAAVPGATGKARADTPSPSPSPSASFTLNVRHNGKLVKSYTLDQVEAMTAFNGWAGYAGKGGTSHGPDYTTGATITDIVADALGSPLRDVQSVEVAEAPVATGYAQTFTGAQIIDPATGFTLSDATTGDPITTPLTGPLAAVLIYTDPAQNVMTPDAGPLRFVISDNNNGNTTTSENAVMTGKFSVSQVNMLDIADNVTVRLRAKPTAIDLGSPVTFLGTVVNHVPNVNVVKLRFVLGTKFVARKSATVTSKGAYRMRITPAKAGTYTFVVTYRVGGHVFMSKQVVVTVKK